MADKLISQSKAVSIINRMVELPTETRAKVIAAINRVEDGAVQCFECQKNGTNECPMAHKDPIFGNLYAENKADSFCSYGERQTT